MFLGEYFHSLDEKGRVVMPSSFRRALEEGCVLTKGQDGQILIYAPDDFLMLAQEVKAEKPKTSEGRRFNRTVFGAADSANLNAGGRVGLKGDLREYAGLEPNTDVALIGVLDHVEVWNKEKYLADRAMGDEVYLEEGDED